jgi:hypothetical protein
MQKRKAVRQPQLSQLATDDQLKSSENADKICNENSPGSPRDVESGELSTDSMQVSSGETPSTGSMLSEPVKRTKVPSVNVSSATDELIANTTRSPKKWSDGDETCSLQDVVEISDSDPVSCV